MTAPGEAADRKPQVERLLTDILGLMGHPARPDVQDRPDGSVSVALHFEGAPPAGVEPGQRSHALDSLQFLLNKMMNRPGQERRWIALGVGGHPEPRAPAPERQARKEAPPKEAPPVVARAAPAARAASKPPPPALARSPEADERAVSPAEDAELSAAARKLAEKASSLGRFYALAAVKLEDRSRILKTVEGVGGVRVSAEGEGRNRRVVFTPAKPAPLPRRLALPEDDEDALDG